MLNQQGSSLVDAVQNALEAEEKAAAFYAESAHETGNPIGQKLFRQLSDFELVHVRVLTDLRASLLRGGEPVPYDGGEVRLPSPADLIGAVEPNRLSVMAIVEAAIEIERRSRQLYRDLAKKTSHPECRSLFERLAAEEGRHLELLDNAYASLNDHGEWDWLSGPPPGKVGR